MIESGDAARAYLGNESSALDVLYDKELLDTHLQENAGLVTIVTTDGYSLCPAEQFTEDSEGQLMLRPELGDAWAAARALDIQFGEDEYATLARFTTPRPMLQNRSWWDVLIDEDASKDTSLLEVIKRDLVADARKRYVVQQDGGIRLQDPRTSLPDV